MESINSMMLQCTEGDRLLPLTEPEPGVYAFDTRPGATYDILRPAPAPLGK